MLFFSHVEILEKCQFAVRRNDSDRTINYYNVNCIEFCNCEFSYCNY